MVTSVEFKNGGPQKVIVDGVKEIEAETVIISTGASAKWLGIPMMNYWK
jgi:thioredoxin reductase (NADPH)